MVSIFHGNPIGEQLLETGLSLSLSLSLSDIQHELNSSREACKLTPLEGVPFSDLVFGTTEITIKDTSVAKHTATRLLYGPWCAVYAAETVYIHIYRVSTSAVAPQEVGHRTLLRRKALEKSPSTLPCGRARCIFESGRSAAPLHRQQERPTRAGSTNRLQALATRTPLSPCNRVTDPLCRGFSHREPRTYPADASFFTRHR